MRVSQQRFQDSLNGSEAEKKNNSLVNDILSQKPKFEEMIKENQRWVFHYDHMQEFQALVSTGSSPFWKEKA